MGKKRIFDGDLFINIKPDATYIWGNKLMENIDKQIIKEFMEISGQKSPTVEDLIEAQRFHTDSKGTITQCIPRVGRNDPCSCGRKPTKKHKNCCLGKAPTILDDSTFGTEKEDKVHET